MKLGVILLNWNGYQDTRECLNSLLPVPQWVELFVVDNGSTDDSVQLLKAEFGDSICLIQTGTNLLFAGGNNAGVQTAMEKGCDAILLLNNDTIVEKSTLDDLREASMRHPLSLLCPKILYYSDRETLWYAGGIWKYGRIAHRGIRDRDKGQYDVEEPTSWGTGCALWIPRKVIETIGRLDEDFKLYYEDVEYCLRAGKSSIQTIYVPTARVWHKVSSSLGGHSSLRKQKRKLRSLGLLHARLKSSPAAKFMSYVYLLFLDPLSALVSKIGRK